MSNPGDRLLEFEEQNWAELAEEFLQSKDIVDKWEQFVYDKYRQDIEDKEYHDEE